MQYICPLCEAIYSEEWQFGLHCWASEMGLLPGHPADSDVKSWWRTNYPAPEKELTS